MLVPLASTTPQHHWFLIFPAWLWLNSLNQLLLLISFPQYHCSGRTHDGNVFSLLWYMWYGWLNEAVIEYWDLAPVCPPQSVPHQLVPVLCFFLIPLSSPSSSPSLSLCIDKLWGKGEYKLQRQACSFLFLFFKAKKEHANKLAHDINASTSTTSLFFAVTEWMAIYNLC